MTHKYTFSFLSITSDKEKCIDQLPDIPALHRTSQGRCRTSQVPDIPALRRTSQGRFRTSQGRCRTSRPCTGHLKAGAGHPRSLCRTSRPCAGHLKAGAGHPRCRTSQVPDIPALRRTSQGRCRTSQDRYRTSRPSAGLLDE